jgi:hypothetical protein
MSPHFRKQTVRDQRYRAAMTATNDPGDPAPARADEPAEAQFGPHRFYISVVMDEEIEHYRFAVRDLAVLEAR